MNDDRGFTLLELLVGIVVLGFLLAGIGGGVRFGIRAADTQARIGTGQNELDATDRLLRRLVTAAAPGTDRFPVALRGTPALLTFTAPMPQSTGGGLGDVALGLGPGNRLLLRWTPHRHVRRTSPPPDPAETELLRGLAGLRFAFWDGAAWQDTWSAPALPLLVRIRLAFPEGDPRRWPDIVVAPIRHAARN